MSLPIYEKFNFLPPAEFHQLEKSIPKDGWKEAVVYNQHLQREVVSKTNRHAIKVHERRKQVIKDIKNLVMPKLLDWLKQQAGFQYIWIRYSHTQWIQYNEGMFFKPHQDFEKYICDHLTPYVALIGLVDTAAGGETIVNGETYTASKRENGLLFFPANSIHEGKVVTRGIKKCLKLEFFVLFSQEIERPLVVHTDNHQWKSYWSKEQLDLVYNYMSSHSRFTGDSSKIEVSSEMAMIIQNAMLAIQDPKKTPEDFGCIFPEHTPSCLHDIFHCFHWIQRRGPYKFYMGTDSQAWEYFNTWEKLPANIYPVVCLWSSSKDEDQYNLKLVYDRNGKLLVNVQPRSGFWYSGPIVNKTKSRFYADYKSIQTNILNYFISSTDLETLSPVKYNLKSGVERMYPTIERSMLKSLKPTNFIKPFYRAGRITETHFEMCNDEESGGHYESEQVYLSFKIQIRWCLLEI